MKRGCVENGLKLNLKYNHMDQIDYLQGYHRSGWKYVVSELLQYQDPKGIKCDMNVDRTFHWLKPSFLPYRDPWIGFVHHTFNTSFSSYNNVELLKNDLFIESLHHCKCLFVFSKQEKIRWENELSKLSSPLSSINVQFVIHPTEIVLNLFTLEKFQNNTNPGIIQIGAWLRNTYSIFKLNDGKSKLPLKGTTLTKYAVIGKDMDKYYKPKNFFNKLSKYLFGERCKLNVLARGSVLSSNGFYPLITYPNRNHDHGTDHGISRDSSSSRKCLYEIGAFDLLKEYDDSVQLLNLQTDHEYDELLAKNVVFIDLIDAAAVNTILECIVRNTPIIVNRLSAILDLLGEEYPLFYNELQDITKFTLDDIINAHLYLTRIDKYQFSITNFKKLLKKVLDQKEDF